MVENITEVVGAVANATNSTITSSLNGTGLGTLGNAAALTDRLRGVDLSSFSSLNVIGNLLDMVGLSSLWLLIVLLGAAILFNRPFQWPLASVAIIAGAIMVSAGGFVASVTTLPPEQVLVFARLLLIYGLLGYVDGLVLRVVLAVVALTGHF